MILATHGIVGSQIQSFVGLLDTYPNAAAAYSVRKLRSDYTGSAIRVRRSSDNTESDIGFSGENLDTTSLSSFCSGTNGFVTTWYDQSGNANNATQTTAANQPQIVSSGNVILKNTKPTLDFDGTNDFLNGGNILNLSQYTYFSVNSSDTISSVQCIFGKGFGGNYFESFGNFYVSSKLRNNITYAGPSESTVFTSLTSSNDTLYLSTGLYNKINLIQRANGANQGSISETRDIINSTQPFTIGVMGNLIDFRLNGRISEIIIYDNSKLSIISNIESSINTYYGIY